MKKNEPQDLFVRRLYVHKGIIIVMDIDLVAKTISMVEKSSGQWRSKKWIFSGRTHEYTAGWQAILDAMKYATTEAAKVLKEVELRDEEEFLDLMGSIGKAMLDAPRP